MSFSYLPFPMYIGLCLTGSLFMLYSAVKRKKIDRPGLIVLYITISIVLVITIIMKIIEEKTNLYSDAFFYIAIADASIIIAELLYLSFTHKGDEISKRKIRIGLGIMGATFSFALIMFLILD